MSTKSREQQYLISDFRRFRNNLKLSVAKMFSFRHLFINNKHGNCYFRLFVQFAMRLIYTTKLCIYINGTNFVQYYFTQNISVVKMKF